MKFLPVIIALFVSVLVGIFALRFFGSDTSQRQASFSQPSPAIVETSQAQEVRVANVYVAARDIPIGTPLQPSDLDTQPWPEHLLIEGFVSNVEEGEQLVGMVTRAPFRAREPLVRTKLANPDDPNFIAGSLPQGFRAFTISTDNISGVAGFLFPGDRVDVVLTHSVLKEGFTQDDLDTRASSTLEEEVTEILVPNVKVLAVNQNSSAPEGGILEIPNSVTLELTPQQVQAIRLGSEVGFLSLSLRSLKDKSSVANSGVTRRSTLSGAEITESNKEDDISVKVIRGTEATINLEAGGS